LDWGLTGCFLRKNQKAVMAVAVRVVDRLKEILVN
jgi:hypothetical protein